jgi:hypothetical protein
MESKFVTLINKENQFIKIEQGEIKECEIPILFNPDITIADLKLIPEFLNIDFQKIDLIGISIVKLIK